jgi:hypothetical protein
MDQGNVQGTSLLQQGIAAARAKRKSEAYGLLRQVVATDPRNIDAWIWLGAVAPTLPEQLQSFERALALDPTNEKAQAGQRWAASRLGGGSAPAPTAPPSTPSASSGGGRISSQDMLGMFGGPPGGSPAPSAPGPSASGGMGAPSTGGGGISSQDMLGMFGGASASAPSSSGGSAGGGISSQDMLGMFGGPAPAPASPAGSSPFGPSPAQGMGSTPTLPPGAPGTPGGAEWRGFSELEGHDPQFNWDDSGADLGSPTPVPAGDRVVARPVPSTNMADTYLTAAPTAPPAAAPPRPAPEPYETQPLPSEPTLEVVNDGGARRETSPTRTRIAILAALIVIILLLLVSLLLGTKLLPSGARPGPEVTVNSFLTQHLSQQYSRAMPYLAPALRSQYAPPDQNLPGLPISDATNARWTLHVVPLANDGAQADVDAYVIPAGGNMTSPGTIGPVRFALAPTPDSNTWLITHITPPPGP